MGRKMDGCTPPLVDSLGAGYSITCVTFPNFGGFERESIKGAARRAIESHDQPEHAMDPPTREMREVEHTGIELTGPELAFLRNDTLERIDEIEGKIAALEESQDQGTEPNAINAEEELQGLRGKLEFIQNNFGEKLFGAKKIEG